MKNTETNTNYDVAVCGGSVALVVLSVLVTSAPDTAASAVLTGSVVCIVVPCVTAVVGCTVVVTVAVIAAVAAGKFAGAILQFLVFK